MRVIQKRVDELEPGDVLVYDRDQFGKLIEPRKYAVIKVNVVDDLVHVWQHRLNVDAPKMNEFARDRTVMLNVEAPELTPAQQQADLLVGCIEKALAIAEHPQPGDFGKRLENWARPARLLFDQVSPKPPSPPTPEELAAALAGVAYPQSGPGPGGKSHHAIALEVLDRARRAGVLK
jgi:hypothetical protein